MSKKKKDEAAEAKTEAQDARPIVSLKAYPRAAASIRRVRGWCGLVGFALVALFCLRAGMALPDAVLRGLAGGAFAHFAGWFVAIKLWRQITLAELEAARERHEARVEEIKRRAVEEATARLAADAERRAAETAVLDTA
jgi:hypothetical protein